MVTRDQEIFKESYDVQNENNYPTHGLCGACGDWVLMQEWPSHFFMDCSEAVQLLMDHEQIKHIPHVLATGKVKNDNWMVLKGSIAIKQE